MGPGDTIGLIAVVVLMIVVLGMAFSAYERRLKFKERKLELEAGRGIATAAGSGGAGQVAASDARALANPADESPVPSTRSASPPRRRAWSDEPPDLLGRA